jgi:hypothetical protein
VRCGPGSFGIPESVQPLGVDEFCSVNLTETAVRSQSLRVFRWRGIGAFSIIGTDDGQWNWKHFPDIRLDAVSPSA